MGVPKFLPQSMGVPKFPVPEFPPNFPPNFPQSMGVPKFLRNSSRNSAFGPSKIEDWDAVWLTVKATVLNDEASRKDFDAQLSPG